MAIDYRAAGAAAALSITVDTLRRNADDAGITIDRKQVGASMARIFHPADLFAIARWRSKNKYVQPALRQAVVSVWGPKGGIGKTTMAGNLAVGLSLQGHSVLIIDLDFQSSLTLSFGYDSELEAEDIKELNLPESSLVEFHLGNLLPGIDANQPLERVIKKPYGEHGPHLVPAELMLDQVDYKLLASTLSGQQSDVILTKWIIEGRSGKNPNCDLSGYDVILFDCPPSKNRLTRAALLASNAVVSPVNFEHFSTKALSYLSFVLNDMKDSYGRCPELMILGNSHDPQRVRSNVHIATIVNRYKDALIDQTVRRSEDFPRALDEEPKMPLLLAKPTSSAAEDVRLVARIIAERLNLFTKE